jgi:alpha-galactosidase
MFMSKFVLIGVGSAIFGAGTIGDLLHFKESFPDATVCLVDVDREKLDLMEKLARIANESVGSPFRIEASTDRRDVLAAADFVITSPAVRREELWRIDWDIVHGAGIRQTYGENGGPGSLALTLRNVPMILAICRDIEELAPDAWVINYTNPESRICMAIDRYTDLKFVGLCHQIGAGYKLVSRALNVPEEDLDIKAAGLNHNTWMYSIQQQSNGKDLYPRMIEKIQGEGIENAPLSCAMYDLFGMFPTPGDHHLAEMLSFGWEFQGLAGRDFAAWHKRKSDAMDWVKGVADGARQLDEVIGKLSGERMAHMAAAIIQNGNNYEISMDVRNCGAIPNLPDDAIVETPGIISALGIIPLRMPPLPEALAALLRKQVAVQELAVEAAVTGDRQTALQAMILDPVVDNLSVATDVLDRLMDASREYIAPGLFR